MRRGGYECRDEPSQLPELPRGPAVGMSSQRPKASGRVVKVEIDVGNGFVDVTDMLVSLRISKGDDA
jgi:hypothetical protein